MPDRDPWKPEDRFLFLQGEITDEQTQTIISRLLAHWDREFLLVINSDGGSSFNALCLTNLMRQHQRVDTLCVGVAMSAAADCLAAGRRRWIVPGSIAMLHQVSWEMGREFAANLLRNAQFLDRLNAIFTAKLVEFTGRPAETLERDLTTDFYLYDQEIIDYGLADAFWNPAELLPPSPPERRSQRLQAEPSDGRRRREGDGGREGPHGPRAIMSGRR